MDGKQRLPVATSYPVFPLSLVEKAHFFFNVTMHLAKGCYFPVCHTLRCGHRAKSWHRDVSRNVLSLGDGCEMELAWLAAVSGGHWALVLPSWYGERGVIAGG